MPQYINKTYFQQKEYKRREKKLEEYNKELSRLKSVKVSERTSANKERIEFLLKKIFKLKKHLNIVDF